LRRAFYGALILRLRLWDAASFQRSVIGAQLTFATIYFGILKRTGMAIFAWLLRVAMDLTAKHLQAFIVLCQH
jgi:hypothetical protein